jgi:hypothetical protein
VSGAPLPVRRFSELSAAEARQVFDDFVAEQASRVESFVEDARRRGAPAEALDFSIKGLEPLWEWFVEAHRPDARSADPYRMPGAADRLAGPRPADPVPWWAAFHPSFYAELGPLLADRVTGLSAYLFACVIRARPGSAWAMGKGSSSAHFRSPVLKVEGRGEWDYGVPIVTVLHALRGEHGKDAPGFLRQLLERLLGLDPAWEAEMARISAPMAPIGVGPIEHARFTHAIDIDGVVAHRQEARVRRLLEALRREDAIADVAWEDREVVLLDAGDLPNADVHRMVERLWETAGRR